MSTRSAIAMKKADGTIHAVYCHFDGYVAGVGVALSLWYNTQERVEQLLALGDISNLGKYLTREECPIGESNITNAYHRDHNEELRPPIIYQTQEDFTSAGEPHFGAEYLYLFDNGKWYVYGVYWHQGWMELSVAIEKEKAKE